MADKVVITMTKERETKNTVRFSAGSDEEPAPLDTLYVPKDTLAELGDPDTLTVTLSAGAGK